MKKKRNKMCRCKRNVLLIFGYLLVMAILFLPYKEGIHSKAGYTFLPLYIVSEFRKPVYSLNLDLLTYEIGTILLSI